jgi:ribose-phosphate pyrophosphokinase
MEIHWSGADGLPTGKCTVGSYPGGEPMVSDFLSRGVVIEKVLIRPKSMIGLMGGLFFLDALEERGQPPPELILPFVPGARQDRLNSSGDFLFTAKSVAREINARQLPRVTILDPHSDVMPALLDRCHVIPAHECFAHITPDVYAAVIAPDAGAEKRASAVAKRLELPLLHGWKRRDITTGALNGFGLEMTHFAPGARMLVVDDICDGGGTFVGLATEVLADRRLKADLYVTHGIFSQGTQLLLQHYGVLFCTDSIVQTDKGVRVIPVCKHLIGGL